MVSYWKQLSRLLWGRPSCGVSGEGITIEQYLFASGTYCKYCHVYFGNGNSGLSSGILPVESNTWHKFGCLSHVIDEG